MSIDSDDLATLRGLLDACKSGNCADHDDFGRRIADLYDYLDPETVSALVSDLEQRGERNEYWMDQANEIARDRARIREERDKLKAEIEALKAEVERLKLYAEAEAKGADRAGKALCVSAKEMREIRAELHCLSMENESLRKDAERYRWLKDDVSRGETDFCIVRKNWIQKALDSVLTLKDADEQIDAAMAKEPGQ